MKSLLSFKGRIGRRSFVYRLIVSSIILPLVQIALNFALIQFGLLEFHSEMSFENLAQINNPRIDFIFVILFALYDFRITCLRFHDLNVSVKTIAPILILGKLLFLIPSQIDGSNKFAHFLAAFDHPSDPIALSLAIAFTLGAIIDLIIFLVAALYPSDRYDNAYGHSRELPIRRRPRHGFEEMGADPNDLKA